MPASASSVMQPAWFFPLFLLWWLFLGGVLAYLGGWTSLAGRFRADGPNVPVDGERFRFASGSLGRGFFPVSYGNCLFVLVAAEGLRLSIGLPFRFLSPPLYIPWVDFESVARRRVLFLEFVTFTIPHSLVRLSLRGAAGRAAEAAFVAARGTTRDPKKMMQA
jgi:hypothetical protein